MQEDPREYGRLREPGDEMPEGETEAPSRLSPQDEKTWSMLSHLSVLAWPLTGLVPVAPLLIWAFYKDRSPGVGFHAAQAFWYQVAWLGILVVGWFATFVLSFVLIGLLFIPVMSIASFAPIIHGCYAAYRVNRDSDYRYPYVADRVEGGGS
jgi:uncharacterized Tic20 family protein